MIYVNMIEDKRGDLVDIEYFCSGHCAVQKHGPAMLDNAWPAMESKDYDIHCSQCDDLIQEGNTERVWYGVRSVN